nr:protein RKD2-like [Ipomoea batatas]
MNKMANPASSPSFSQHIDRSYIGTSEYAEYSIWDDQYEDFPPASETLESFHKQSSSIGPEFDPFWDFKNEVEGLSKAKDVIVAEVVEVERNSIEATVAIDARDKSVAVTVFEEEGDKTLDESLSLEVVSRYFHLPLAQAAKALQIGEASLKKIRCRLGIKRWPFRKLHSLEKLIKDVQFVSFYFRMANISSSSFLAQNIDCLTEFSSWNEVILLDSANNPLLNQCFDHIWDFEHHLEKLSRTTDVTTSNASVVAENITHVVDATATTGVVDLAAREYIFEGFIRRKRGKRTFCKPSTLTQEMVSRYFHLPMKQAAKELRIGEAPLKRVCRRLGINRWPYRKLQSWERLAEDVQQFDKLQENAEKRENVKNLEDRMKQLIREPNLELDHKTFKLREACYKKRKYYKSVYLAPSTSFASPSSVPPVATSPDPRIEEEDDVINALLDDQCPPGNMFEN